MGVVTLSNGVLSAQVAGLGAELKSVKELSTGIEYLWQANPAWWSGSAPILFPIIGGLKKGTYTYKGQTYAMAAHGIVRKKEWALVSSTATSAVFQTGSSEESRKSYPFDFTLRCHVGLEGNRLAVRYEVVNTGGDKMYFSIGSHPAFNIPFAGGDLENYYYHFSEPESIERHFFADGLHLNKTAPVFDNSREIFLTRHLFDKLAIILKHPASKTVALRNSRNSKQVRVITEGMPYLGLWAPSGAPFACIEPWYGVPDNENAEGDLTTKEGIIPLESKGVFNTTYKIEII